MASSSLSPLYMDPRISKVGLIYRIFFLYMEPIFALGGAYLCLFDPAKFLVSTAPASIYSDHPYAATPVIDFLAADVGALYLLFAINEGITLRLTRDYSVWKSVVAAMLVCDFGHLWGIYSVAPEQCLDFVRWTNEERFNYLILIFGAILRAAFLMGIGNKR
ncbi:Basic amino-acid permease [Clarireedia jacksonii]